MREPLRSTVGLSDGRLMLDTFAQIFSIVCGGSVVSLFWSWRSDQLEQYRYLDAAYAELLTQYRANPEFGSALKAAQYDHAFANTPDNANKRDAYHYFAMTVHNTMETIFDTLDEDPLQKSRQQWARIFEYHVRLHYAWLQDNQLSFEPKYVEYVERLADEWREAARQELEKNPAIVHMSELMPVPSKRKTPSPDAEPPRS